VNPRDAEEKRIIGGTITPAARDAEEKRHTGAAISAPSRDAEETRIKAGAK
jgi:hypothetical protein